MKKKKNTSKHFTYLFVNGSISRPTLSHFSARFSGANSFSFSTTTFSAAPAILRTKGDTAVLLLVVEIIDVVRFTLQMLPPDLYRLNIHTKARAAVNAAGPSGNYCKGMFFFVLKVT